MGYKSNRPLSSKIISIITLSLLFEQRKNSIVDQGVEGVVEELSHRHFVVVFFVLDHLEQVLEEVLVGAGVLSLFDFFLAFVAFLDLLDEELNFFFEHRVVRALSDVKLYFHEILVILQHIDEFLHSLLLPRALFALSKLKFFQRFVVNQRSSHLKEPSVRYNAQVQLLDVLVYVGSLNNSEEPVFVEVYFFEVQLLNGVVGILDEGVSEIDSGAFTEVVVLREV